MSLADTIASIEAGLQSAFQYSEAKINQFFTGVTNLESYVVHFFQTQGPVLIKGAEDAKAGVDSIAAVASSFLPAEQAEIKTAQTVIDGAINLFENLVTGLIQGSQQGTGAQSLMASGGHSQLDALRDAQSNLDIAKARAALVIRKYGMRKPK